MGGKQDGKPVPRDLPDQQAGPGQDPWEAAESRQPQEDTDGGAPQTEPVENPTPDEPSA
ncbi:hypothetical protein AB0M11_09695 [Streptomyces sp. NPDC051987]|uniref:hypothetical protein n=1 Tax=Streptomyces sp. NPDC051987 TaxID=3155808 RepID=UPI00342255B2